MSFYTSSIKTNISDARLDKSNKRFEFRFGEDQAVLSNMRIAGLGVTGTAGNYNIASGAYSCVKSIHLYDGSQLLDQQLQFDIYSAFKNYNKDNASNRTVNGFLSRANMGYEVQGEDTANNAFKIGTTFPARSFDTTSATTSTAWLDLKSCLPFLQTLMVLPTSVFKNLRVVVEYATPIAAAQQTEPPVLIYDEMADPSQKPALLNALNGNSFDYAVVEHDSITVPAVPGLAVAGDTAVQKVSKLVKGFDNKRLDKLLVVKTSQDSAGVPAEMGQLGSQLFLREKENLRVNGRQLLPFGIDSPAKALASVTDVFGTCNSYLNRLHISTDPNNEAVLSAQPLATLGNQDYRAFLVGERIEQLELSFERTGEHNAGVVPLNASVVLNLFGQVTKRIDVRPNGSYIIGYVQQ